MFRFLNTSYKKIFYIRNNKILNNKIYYHRLFKNVKIKEDECRFCKGVGVLYDEETSTSSECFICGGTGISHQIY